MIFFAVFGVISRKGHQIDFKAVLATGLNKLSILGLTFNFGALEDVKNDFKKQFQTRYGLATVTVTVMITLWLQARLQSRSAYGYSHAQATITILAPITVMFPFCLRLRCHSRSAYATVLMNYSFNHKHNLPCLTLYLLYAYGENAPNRPKSALL